MNHSEVLSQLYDLLEPKLGHTLAHETTSAVYENSINQVYELGLGNDPHEINKRLRQYLEDFRVVVESNKASLANPKVD